MELWAQSLALRNTCCCGHDLMTTSHGTVAHGWAIVLVGQVVILNHHQAVTHPCNSTSMSIVVLSQTSPLSIPLTVMITKTGFQICYGILKHDQPSHCNK